MAVKLELYRVFQEVARMGNISAAAQNLFISQSAVSQSIKQLEEQLQVRLFSRSTRGVVLTSEGKLLLDYVSHGLGLIQCGEEKLAQSRQLLTGELIIGASDTVTKTYLVSRLEAFHQNYPAIQIRILNGTSQMVLDYLHAGQVVFQKIFIPQLAELVVDNPNPLADWAGPPPHWLILLL